LLILKILPVTLFRAILALKTVTEPAFGPEKSIHSGHVKLGKNFLYRYPIRGGNRRKFTNDRGFWTNPWY
jgi:hypothetical protein